MRYCDFATVCMSIIYSVCILMVKLTSMSVCLSFQLKFGWRSESSVDLLVPVVRCLIIVHQPSACKWLTLFEFYQSMNFVWDLTALLADYSANGDHTFGLILYGECKRTVNAYHLRLNLNIYSNQNIRSSQDG